MMLAWTLKHHLKILTVLLRNVLLQFFIVKRCIFLLLNNSHWVLPAHPSSFLRVIKVHTVVSIVGFCCFLSVIVLGCCNSLGCHGYPMHLLQFTCGLHHSLSSSFFDEYSVWCKTCIIYFHVGFHWVPKHIHTTKY